MPNNTSKKSIEIDFKNKENFNLNQTGNCDCNDNHRCHKDDKENDKRICLAEKENAHIELKRQELTTPMTKVEDDISLVNIDHETSTELMADIEKLKLKYPKICIPKIINTDKRCHELQVEIDNNREKMNEIYEQIKPQLEEYNKLQLDNFNKRNIIRDSEATKINKALIDNITTDELKERLKDSRELITKQYLEAVSNNNTQSTATDIPKYATAYSTNTPEPQFNSNSNFDFNQDIRSYNIGTSNYSKHKIQPWDIWEDYNLNPWDADIIKRVLREKTYEGKSQSQSRIEDYQKIIHVCLNRIRQLNQNS